MCHCMSPLSQVLLWGLKIRSSVLVSLWKEQNCIKNGVLSLNENTSARWCAALFENIYLLFAVIYCI